MKTLNILIFLWLQCTTLLLQECSGFVTTRVCNFEDNNYCDWSITSSNGVEGTYGLTTAGNASSNVGNTQRPQTDFVPGNINGSYFYYIKPNNYYNQALLLSYPSQKYLTNMSFAYFMTGPQGLSIIQAHVMSFEINSNFTLNQSRWEQALIQFSSTNPNYGIIIESPSLPGGGGEAPIEGDPFLAIDNIVLTFTLPCDFSSLSFSGNLVLSHPAFLNIVLGQINSVQFMASSPICSQGPFIYTIESNNVTSLDDIFQFNSSSGLLAINATGPHLIGQGVTLGVISVSVHVHDSGYMQPNGVAFKRYATLHYRQPPTITVSSAPSIAVSAIGMEFSYTVIALSALNVELSYAVVRSDPSSLADNITITNNVVSGVLTHQHIVDTIQQQSIQQNPSFTVMIRDSFNESRNYTVQLVLPAQLPLVFNQLEYLFTISEDNDPSTNPTVGDIFIGSIPYLECPALNGSINTTNNNITSTFTLIRLPHTFLSNFCTFRLIVTKLLDYEKVQQYVFNLTVYDSNSGWSAVTMVTIQVIGVNEYDPSISPKQQHVQVTDYQLVDSLVLSLIGMDNDQGQDGYLSYSITEGNTDYFKLVQISNTLVHLVISHSPLVPGNYLVQVTVTDGGSPARSDVAMVTASVIASSQIQCNESLFGSPLVTGITPPLRPPIHSNVTIQCNYTANPAVYPIKWYKSTLTDPYSYQLVSSSNHYIISGNTLLINHVMPPNDIGYFTCNITNQCGHNATSIPLLLIINYPAPPTQLMIIGGPAQQSISFTWTPPIITIPRPVNGYAIQLKQVGGAYKTHSNLTYYSENNIKITQITLDQLYPGVNYTARILSVNDYFNTSSNVIHFTTLTSAPKLAHFTVTVTNDNAIAVNWELEYSGGSHDLHMTITIQSEEVTEKRRRRKRSSYVPVSLSYPVHVDDNMLTTHTLPFGQHYQVVGVVSSEHGNNQYSETVFIGVHDILRCSFSMDSSCQWTLNGGQLTLSSSVSLPRPLTDATQQDSGVYVLGSVSDSNNEEQSIVLMSYTPLTYVCGISFYYQTNHNMRLRLETSNYGNQSLIWDSPIGDHSSQWTPVNIPIGEFPLSLSTTGSLRVAMEMIGTPSPVLSYVAVDEVSLHFCLPCNYTNLTQDSIKLTYNNYSTVYIRQQNQTLSVQTTVNDCPNALLHYTIQSVVPNQLESLILLPNQRKGDISISDVSTDIVEAGTTGYIIVKVEVLSSDYAKTGVTLSSLAVLHFIIAERYENCSYSKSCDFEDSRSCDWELSDQLDSSIKQMSSNFVLFAQPSQVGGEGGVATIGHQLINDSYCGIDFLLQTFNGVTLQVSVTGIGTVWSSWTDTPTNYNSSWKGVSIYIDIGSVPMMSGRRVSLEMIIPPHSVSGSFIAIDNITLHPCIDCQAQECSCISCIQQCSVSPCKDGYYLSLDVNQCRPCPKGYYCDNWRSLPKPCPPGTFNELTASYSPTDCQRCSNGTYTVQRGSSSCVDCPTGYNCTDPSIIPVLLCNNNPTTTTTDTSYMSLVIAAVIGLCAGIVLSCLIGATISCYCCHYKNKRVNRMRKKEHKMYQDNFYVNPERHRKSSGYKSATVRTASTILSMMGKETEDGNKAYTNPAFDSDSDDDFSRVSILTSDELHPPPPRDPSINSFQKVDWSDKEPLAGGREGESNPFSVSYDDTKSEISDMIELDDHNDHVWPALQRKKKQQQREKEEYDI